MSELGIIKKVWKRRQDAEGNPFHKCFTRDPMEGEIKLLEDGLVDSFDWHRDKQVKARKQAGDSPNDRAILIQTKENVEKLQKLFPNVDSIWKDSSFGENFFVEGNLLPENLCIGDVLEIQRDKKCMCKLQITSPRWPCFKIDYKHSETLKETPFEEKVRATCVESGLAGFFCKVIQEGTIQKDDQLVVVKRTQPKWSLARTSQVFYGGINKKRCNIVEFLGTKEEFDELLKMEELADFEWKDRLKEYVQKKENEKIEAEQKKIDDEKKRIEDEKKRIEDERVSKERRIRLMLVLIPLLIGIIGYYLKKNFLK